jgi:hypothetical protein
MYIPNTYSVSQIDIDILPNDIYADVLARNYNNVRSYVISNPTIIQQLSFLNRAIRSSYNYISKGNCGNSYNLTYTSKFSVDNSVSLVTLNPQQLYEMYRFIVNIRMTNSNVAYLMNVAFSLTNQLQSAKRTILNNGQVCINCDLLPMIQNPQQLATNDSARVINFIVENKGNVCVSGDLYNLQCGGSGQAI